MKPKDKEFKKEIERLLIHYLGLKTNILIQKASINVDIDDLPYIEVEVTLM